MKTNARLKHLIARMTEQLEVLTKRAAPAPPLQSRAQTAHHPFPQPVQHESKRCRVVPPPKVLTAESGEVLPRYGDFPRFAPMQMKTVLVVEDAASGHSTHCSQSAGSTKCIKS